MPQRSVPIAVVVGFCGLLAAWLSIRSDFFLGEMDFDTAEFMPEILSTGVTDYSLHPGISPLLSPFAAARAAGIALWPALQLNMLLFLGAAFAAFAFLIRPIVPDWSRALAGAGLFLLLPGIQEVNNTMSDKVLSRPLLLCSLAALMSLMHAKDWKLQRAFTCIGFFMAALMTCLAYFFFIPLIAALLLWRFYGLNSSSGKLVRFGLACAAFALASGAGLCLLDDLYIGREAGHTWMQAYNALAYPAEFASSSTVMQGSASRLFFVGISESLFGTAKLAGYSGVFGVEYLVSSPLPAALGKAAALLLCAFTVTRIVRLYRAHDWHSASYFAILLLWIFAVSAFLLWYHDPSIYERWEFLAAAAPFFFFRHGEFGGRFRKWLPALGAAYFVLCCAVAARSPTGASSMARVSAFCRPEGRPSVFTEGDLPHKGAAIHAYLAGCRPLSVIEYDYGKSPFRPPEHLRPDWRIPRSGAEIEKLRAASKQGTVYVSPAAAAILDER